MTAPFRGSTSGLVPQQLRVQRFRRVGRDVYQLRGDGPLSLRDRVLAALVAVPDGVACLSTAAALLNLPVDDDGVLHLARPPSAHRIARPGLEVRRVALLPEELSAVDGLLLTDGPRTLVDLAARL